MVTTPRYLVDLDKFRKNCSEIENAFRTAWGKNTEFGYSVKTNRDPELIKYAHDQLGWKTEVVSPDEYVYAKTLGNGDRDIILNGPCKIGLFREMRDLPWIINLDNEDEVDEFASLFQDYTGFVGLRVNFDLESRCPGETTAGEEVSRFGIDADLSVFVHCVQRLKEHGITKIGLHLHSSTRTRSLRVFSELARKAVELKAQTGTDFSFVDIGGGFFGGQKVAGKPTMTEYAGVICENLSTGYEPEKTMLVLEPGASVLATCVSYETRIVNRREIRGVAVLTVDGTALHINPFLQKRSQPFDVLDADYLQRQRTAKQIVAGATCMENDRLATLTDSAELKKGDILSFHFAGAYTMAFNSSFIINPPQVDYLHRRQK